MTSAELQEICVPYLTRKPNARGEPAAFVMWQKFANDMQARQSRLPLQHPTCLCRTFVLLPASGARGDAQADPERQICSRLRTCISPQKRSAPRPAFRPSLLSVAFLASSDEHESGT